jgi:hypothetical protein
MLIPGYRSAFNPRKLFAGGRKGVVIDATRLDTLFQDTARATPITAAGQTVKGIADLSGNGCHASNASSTLTYEVDASGRGYINFTGVLNSSIATSAIDLTGSDEVTVFAAFRKTSDAAIGTIAELSASASSNAGSFWLLGPGSTVNKNYQFRSRGSASATVNSTALATNAPVTNVVTGIGDISTDTCKIRVNGVEIASDVTDQGTGNFGNYQLFIGSRNNASIFVTGGLYGLIVMGGAVTASEIAQTEQWLRDRSGAY